ncbi:MAG TPA: PilZ domain-containing protein, partial [Terriglobales bacterium]|nr:PilZ domain-containing protein [Terriglobales bacterium]
WKIVTDRPLIVGAMLEVSLDVPREKLPITVRMPVVHGMLKYEFGIEFLDMEDLQRERLARYRQTLAQAAA